MTVSRSSRRRTPATSSAQRPRRAAPPRRGRLGRPRRARGGPGGAPPRPSAAPRSRAASAARARSTASAISLLLASGSTRASPRTPRWFSVQPAAGVGDDRVGQPEPLGDRERLRAARQADREPVRGRQRLEVELHRCVARRRRLVGVDLDLGVVGRRGDQRARADEVVEQRLGQRRALGGVGAGAQLVEQDERARARPAPRSG